MVFDGVRAEESDARSTYTMISDGNKHAATILTLPALIRSPLSVRFMYLFKNALNKAAYCVNCGECMAECAFGALNITHDDIVIDGCRHCEHCLDLFPV